MSGKGQVKHGYVCGYRRKQFPKEVFSDWLLFHPYYQRPTPGLLNKPGVVRDLVAALGESDEPVRLIHTFGQYCAHQGKNLKPRLWMASRSITFTILLSVLRELTADTKVAGDLERFLVEKGSSLLDTRIVIADGARQDQYF